MPREFYGKEQNIFESDSPPNDGPDTDFEESMESSMDQNWAGTPGLSDPLEMGKLALWEGRGGTKALRLPKARSYPLSLFER